MFLYDNITIKAKYMYIKYKMELILFNYSSYTYKRMIWKTKRNKRLSRISANTTGSGVTLICAAPCTLLLLAHRH